MARYELRARFWVLGSTEPNPFVFYPYRSKFLGKRAVRRYNSTVCTMDAEFYLYDKKKKEEVF